MAIAGYNKDSAARTESFYGSMSLTFSVSDRHMADSIEWAAAAIEPDIVGAGEQIAVEEDAAGEALYWRDVSIPVKVKDADVEEASTYARAGAISCNNRLWILVITFNHQKGTIRFHFLHPGGLTSAKNIALKTADGVEAFAHMMSYIMSWKNAFEAGFDTTRDGIRFHIPKTGLYEWTGDLFRGTNLVGRGTEVLRLSKVSTGPSFAPPPSSMKVILKTHESIEAKHEKMETLCSDSLRECIQNLKTEIPKLGEGHWRDFVTAHLDDGTEHQRQ